MLLSIYWHKDKTPDRFTRYGEVSMRVGDLVDPPLTGREMQDIAYAAKMEFAKVMRKRKKLARVRLATDTKGETK